MTQKLVDNLLHFLPGELADDVRNNFNASIKAGLDKMNLVTREEFEIQRKVLQRTREKLDALNKEVESLQEQINNS